MSTAMAYRMEISYACVECGRDFLPRNQPHANKLFRALAPAYCEPKCGFASRARVSSVTMAATNRRYASERMRLRNPMRNPDVRRRVSDSLRAVGHRPAQRGGNGTGPTSQQAALFNALTAAVGEVWRMEFVVVTGLGRSPGPTHYKIDIAHPAARVAIEIDGNSHGSVDRQRADARKDAFLRRNGWAVLRFTNARVDSALSEVIGECLRSLSTR